MKKEKKVSGNTSSSDGVSFHWLLAKQTAPAGLYSPRDWDREIRDSFFSLSVC
jgi:hypothetical protein